MTAPAYTSTWIAAMNWRVEQHEDPRQREHGGRPARGGTRPGCAGVMHSSADSTATAAKKSEDASRVIYSPLGSDGSHSVETGWVCDESRSRSYTKRSRLYSEFS